MFVVQTNAQINFVKKGFDELLVQAKNENKLLFIDAYTDWCGWCKVLDKETFSNAQVANFMNSHFINAKMEMEKEPWGIKIAQKYVINSFPTALIFNQAGELIYIFEGYLPPTDFLKKVETASLSENHLHLKGYSKGFEIQYAPFYLQAMTENGKRKFPNKTEVNIFIDSQTNKFSEESWVVMKRFNSMLNEANNKLFLDNYTKYATLFGNYATESMISQQIYMMIDSAAKTKNEKLFYEALAINKRYLNDFENNEKWYNLQYAEATEDWLKFADVAEEWIKAEPTFSVATINGFAWSIYEKCNDMQIIKRAIAWMDAGLRRESSYAYFDTYAALLYKSGQVEEAEKYALEAIELGKKENTGTKPTEELLMKIKAGKK